MGSATAKQFLIANEKPVIVHSFEKFKNALPQTGFVLVLHPSLNNEWENIREEFLPWLTSENFICCDGGAERSDSVSNGLEEIARSGWIQAETEGWVAIHDAVRPLIKEEIIQRSFEIARAKGNAVVCVPVKSSIRIKTETGSLAVDRDLYFHVQTPQVFRLSELLSWYRQRPATLFTDDASLAEYFGCDIHLCEGNYDNIKITTPEDLALAEILLKKK